MATIGTKKEQKLFDVVKSHYEMAKEDLDARIPSWDRKLELFYSYIDESSWPYSAQVFVPQTFTALFEKMARLNGDKPRGRLIPREGGDVIKGKINNEILNFQWDDSSRVDNEPLTAKWAKMDLNARIYGASFGLVKWRYEEDDDGNVLFDGPVLKILPNKDCLPNPGYSTVKNWFQYRDYLTIEEMENVNDVSGSKPVYKNLGLLKKTLHEKAQTGGDYRETNYTPKGKEMLGLIDYLGKDEAPEFNVVEVVTELRNNQKIVFAPRYGVILQETENPYNHKQIPVICLKYIPVDDDIYGLSEIEPVEKVQKAMNAITSQFIDAINMDLYRIMQVNPTEVQMHTLEWGPGNKWLMNRPGQSVIPLEHSVRSTNQFVNVYSVLVSMFKEAMGETSAAFSSLKPFSGEKTATEITSLETTKSIRDNFNRIFLSEAIKNMTSFWFLMNQQFLFQDPSKEAFILRIVGREAIDEFKKIGLGDSVADTSETEMLGMAETIAAGVDADVNMVPKYPVSMGDEIKPKFEMDETGELGSLYVVPEDMVGSYDFIVDVEPMSSGNSRDELAAIKEASMLLLNPNVAGLLQQEGKRIKTSEILMDLFDKMNLKNSSKYFEAIPQEELSGPEQPEQGAIPGGANPNTAGGIDGGFDQTQGMGSSQAVAGGQGLPLMG